MWNKARKIETETSLQRAERLEVLSKTKQERLRQRQVNNERRATRDVEQNKASQYCWWKAETSHERADRLDDMSTIAILYFYVVARNGWPC